MRNHQQQHQDQDQETMVSMDSHKNPNLETTHNHHHILPSPSSSSLDSKWTTTTHHQQSTHLSKNTHEDKLGFIFKNANLEVIKNPNFLSSSSTKPSEDGCTTPPPPPPQDFKKAHHQHKINVSNKINENEGFAIKNTSCEVINKLNPLSCSSSADGEEVALVEESGRDRLKRHRVEMAGRVRIPDIWGHEDLLKEWIDCTVFDSSLGNNSIMSARAALVQERRSTLRIQN